MDGPSIRQVIEKVLAGQVRIPAFQRGFVWDAERVAYLMDSIYKGYPFGAVILWRTREALKVERRLGPFELPPGDPDYPIDYVLDGQQRLTSIFGVFQTEITPVELADWTNIYFDFAASEDRQESQFVAIDPAEASPTDHFPISAFFEVAKYRSATDALDTERVRLIDQVQSVFKEAKIPVQYIETNDRAKVAIVFERVNRLGVELDVFQLLSAWTWSEEFDLQQRFTDLSEELRPFGFEDVGEDTNLLLRCCAAIVANDASPTALMGLNGAQVRERFPEIINGVRGAIDFLRNQFKVERLDNLPYSTLLVPLSAYFAAPEGTSVKLIEAHRKTLVRWLWRACFSRRYSAGVIRNLNRDIGEAINLRKREPSTLGDFPASVETEFFTDQRFNVSTVHTRTLVLLLAQAQPLSFVSGASISLSQVLQAYNRNEFHHLYPRSYLRGQGVETADTNKLANFVFMSSQDNKTLGGSAPSIYRARMDAEAVPKILERSLCPASLFDDDYDQFVADRAALLVNAARAHLT